MGLQTGLNKSAFLLKEFQSACNSLPYRLRVLTMLTYTLDILYIHETPSLIRNAEHSKQAVQRLRALTSTVSQMLDEAAESVHTHMLPALAQRGIRMCSIEHCSAEETQWLANHFAQRIRPLLTPLAVDAGHPFPQISTHSLNLLAVLQEPLRFDIDPPSFARLKVPRWVPRLIGLACPETGEPQERKKMLGCSYILSEDMVRSQVHTLFNGMAVAGVYQFRILRGDTAGGDKPIGRHTALARQKAWPVVRLDVERHAPDWVVQWLQRNLGVQDALVLRRPAPLGLGTLAGEWAERASIISPLPPGD